MNSTSGAMDSTGNAIDRSASAIDSTLSGNDSTQSAINGSPGSIEWVLNAIGRIQFIPDSSPVLKGRVRKSSSPLLTLTQDSAAVFNTNGVQDRPIANAELAKAEL